MKLVPKHRKQLEQYPCASCKYCKRMFVSRHRVESVCRKRGTYCEAAPALCTQHKYS